MWFGPKPSSSLFAHEKQHAIEYLWEFVRGRMKDGSERRAEFAALIAECYEQWDKKSNSVLNVSVGEE